MSLLFRISRYTFLIHLLLFIAFAEAKVKCDSLTDLWSETLAIEQMSLQDKLLGHTQTILSDMRSEIFYRFFEECIESNFAITTTKHLPVVERHKLYTLMSKVTFYTQDNKMLFFMSSLLSSFPDNDPNKAQYAKTLQNRYIRNWMFSEAAELGIKYGLSDIDHDFTLIGKETGNKQVIVPSINEGRILDINYLLEGAHVIVVGSTICHPSERFSEWLNKKPHLRKIMDEHSTWITRQNGDLRLNEILEYNSLASRPPYNYVYKKHQWTEIQYWGTPTLYFFNKNKLVRQLVGWPKEGREEQLNNALAAIGLL